MRPMRAVWCVVFCAGLAAPSDGAPPQVRKKTAAEFTQTPQAQRLDDGKVKITFAVSAPTDCAVYVLDAKGKVVRHLAAGVLGESAPAPLKRGLTQEVVWDGKDDLGKPVPMEAGFRVRVGLGLKPRFDRMIGWNPAWLGSVRALAVSPKGELFAFHVFGGLHPSDGTLACSAFDREGRYLREVLPYRAGLPEEKVKGLKRITLDDGTKVPFIYQAETRSLVPGAGDVQDHQAIATSDGRVAFVGLMEYLRYSHAGPLHMTVVNADGSVPPDGVVKTLIHKAAISASLALSPDEKTIYASDVRKAKEHYGIPLNVVYRFGWEDKEAAPFLGGAEAAGEARLDDPKGLVTNSDGDLFVADKGNGRVAVFKPDGAFVGALKCTKPERVAVHHKTGAVYVLGGPGINELTKYTSWKDPAPVARVTLPTFKHDGYRVVMVLDDTAEPPVLWVSSWQGRYARFTLLRIEDKPDGSGFGAPVDLVTMAHNRAASAGAVTDVNLDRLREEVYVNRGPRFEGRTGKADLIEVPVPRTSYREGAVVALGPDGFIYQHSSGVQKGVYRFDRALKPAPFVGSESNYIANDGSLRLRARGLTVDHRGRVYLLWQKPKEKQSPGDHEDANALAVYGPDGTLINDKLVDAEMRSINSVRVDYQGNIYLAAGLRPGTETLPPGLKGKLPAGRKDPDAVLGVNFYPYIYGSIVKFGPEGGVIRKGSGGVACNYNVGLTTHVTGAQWIFPGASNVPSWRVPSPRYYTPDICLCESPRFDVDGFGRSFFPDAGRFRVGVIDTGGNEVCWFGSYGNQDSAGPKSAVPVPDIPLCWPHAVAVGDEAVYVGDRLNRRVVRVALNYQAEAMCSVGRQAMFEEDIIKTSAGDLKITFVGHGTLMFMFGQKIIHVDPVSREADYGKMPKADIILITHEHGDHLDPAAIAAIRREDTALVLTETCASKVPGGAVMKNGDVRTVGGLKIEAVPAYNIVHKRPSGEPFHPPGRGNGYIITFGDKRVYVAGDTENTSEMKKLTNVDVAFLPMNVPYTMTPEMVADAARAFRPRILYPYHFGETDTSELVRLLAGEKDIEVRIRRME